MTIENTLTQLDMRDPNGIEIDIQYHNGNYTLWVMVDGVCRLRAQRISFDKLSLSINNKTISAKVLQAKE